MSSPGTVLSPVSKALPVSKAFDVERVRDEFPGLDQEIHGHPLVYLDNAATAQKPRAVIDAVTRFYEHDTANIHRGVHTLGERATATYERGREAVGRFLGVPAGEVIFTRGTTESINLVARSFLRPRLSPGDRVLVSELEHHANLVPWQIVCEEAGAEVVPIPVDDRGALDLDALDQLLDEGGNRVRMVAVASISNAIGTVVPVREVVERSHARKVPVLVDGAQAVPHAGVDLGDPEGLACDFFAFSGHKAYGPSGIGGLWARAEHLEAMPPMLGGGNMIRSVSFDGTTFAGVPQRFEAGTANLEGVAGLAAALDFLSGLDREAVAAHEAELLAHATEELEVIPGVTVIGTAPEKAAILSFVVDGVHPHDLGTILDRRGVAVRAGHHCAQPLMRRFGVPATARASFGLYNTHREVEALAAAVGHAQEVFGV
jgi:cysteine desulfurase / selenocysteine lyase